jgi:RNA polymerase sigma factor (sigma-70 family)
VGSSGSHNLTREGLARLLARLDPDAECAGEKYQNLHRKLVKLFEWRRASCAEDLADETIDRVIRKLDEVDIHEVSLYAVGVAQNVWRESQRAEIKKASLEDLPVGTLFVNPKEDEKRKSEKLQLAARLDCLDECMRILTTAERSLVIGYYEKKKSENIQHRREMAEQLGISLGTLRVQALRVRGKLAACVDKCLAEPD